MPGTVLELCRIVQSCCLILKKAIDALALGHHRYCADVTSRPRVVTTVTVFEKYWLSRDTRDNIHFPVWSPPSPGNEQACRSVM
jgi:hypothetical protein